MARRGIKWINDDDHGPHDTGRSGQFDLHGFWGPEDLVSVPLVDWSLLVEHAFPLKAATRARYRTLKAHGLSEGVTVVNHGDHGLEGRGKFHSVLYLLAIRAKEAGDEKRWRLLSDGGQSIEESHRSKISSWVKEAGHHDLFTHADWYQDMARDTSHVLQQWQHLDSVVYLRGLIAETDEVDARVTGHTTASHEHVDLHLPVNLLKREELGVGDAVWVLRITIGGSALIDLLSAVPTPADDLCAGLDERLETADAAGDDEAAEAARYRAGACATPTDAELAEIRGLAAALPTRRIRVA